MAVTMQFNKLDGDRTFFTETAETNCASRQQNLGGVWHSFPSARPSRLVHYYNGSVRAYCYNEAQSEVGVGKLLLNDWL